MLVMLFVMVSPAYYQLLSEHLKRLLIQIVDRFNLSYHALGRGVLKLIAMLHQAMRQVYVSCYLNYIVSGTD